VDLEYRMHRSVQALLLAQRGVIGHSVAYFGVGFAHFLMGYPEAKTFFEVRRWTRGVVALQSHPHHPPLPRHLHHLIHRRRHPPPRRRHPHLLGQGIQPVQRLLGRVRVDRQQPAGQKCRISVSLYLKNSNV